MDLSHDVALEASDDLGFAEALGDSAFDVGAGAGVVLHPAEHDRVDGVVCLAVPAAVEAVPISASRARGQRRDAAEVGQCGVIAQALGVVPGGDPLSLLSPQNGHSHPWR